MAEFRCRKRDVRALAEVLRVPDTITCEGDGQNTDPQSMDYPNGLPNWTTLKWTKPKNNNRNEYYLIFLAASIIKLHKSSAYVHHVQLLATSLSNYT